MDSILFPADAASTLEPSLISPLAFSSLLTAVRVIQCSTTTHTKMDTAESTVVAPLAWARTASPSYPILVDGYSLHSRWYLRAIRQRPRLRNRLFPCTKEYARTRLRPQSPDPSVLLRFRPCFSFAWSGILISPGTL